MSTQFGAPGPQNTENTLQILQAGIERSGVRQVVVASTFGDTGLAAARLLHGSKS